MILNKTAWNLMRLKNPLNEPVRVIDKAYKVIAVVDDVIKGSPFEPVKPTVFIISNGALNVLNIKLAPSAGASTALGKIGNVFKQYNPDAPFEYKFVDEKYATKFATEERIASLAGFFAALAIFISCLGLFGLASFVAEQRTKEIGIRKVLGATILNVWQLLSREFFLLVFIALLIASPLAWYIMHNWLENYQYRIEMSFTILGLAACSALFITLLTVSFHAIRAGMANPVKSLRTE